MSMTRESYFDILAIWSRDNRPENLGLWTRPQPAGIRVSDAITWAREILALYTGVSDTSNNAQG